MTSVNSPACLLACNHFYRNLPPSPEPSPASISCQNDSVRHKQRQVTLWVSMATPPGLSTASGSGSVDIHKCTCCTYKDGACALRIPAGIGAKGLWVNIDLGFSPSLPFSTSKPSDPAHGGAK